MQIKQILDHLEKTAPLPLQEQYDNSGLLTGNPEMDVTSAIVCIDCTEDVVNEAINTGCKFIIAHHPLIFSGIKKLTGADYIQRAIIKAIKNDVAVYAFHTNADNVYSGVNAMICKKLGILNPKILSPKKNLLRKIYTFCPKDKADEVRQALFSAGCGNIGNYDECSFNSEGFGTFRGMEGSNPYVGKQGKQHHENEVKIETIYPFYLEKTVISALLKSHPYEEVAYDIVSLENEYNNVGSGMIGELHIAEDERSFLEKVKERMKTGCIRHTKLLNRKIKKVAVCGGSGSFLLKNAIASGADIFITGDMKYHQFFDAAGRIIIADIGHYESEQFTMELIHDLLKEKFSTFAVRFSDVYTNPVFYF